MQHINPSWYFGCLDCILILFRQQRFSKEYVLGVLSINLIDDNVQNRAYTITVEDIKYNIKPTQKDNLSWQSLGKKKMDTLETWK